MKKVPLKKIVVLVTLGMILFMSKGMAQVEKGVTSTGKEVDCSTINPSVDKTVSEYGKIVTHPRVTRNGKLITDDCGCPVSIDCTNCTDTVNCISITMSAPILSGNVTSAVLQVFSDAGYTTQVGSDITATVSDGKITAVAANLNCYTKYYLRLKLNNNSNCVFEWNDSTRDATLEKATYCTVANIRTTAVSETDQSHEHLVAGSTTQIDSVYDHEGNVYRVVQIGTGANAQCWLKENMRAKTSPSTHNQIVMNPMVQSFSSKSAGYYDNNESQYGKYGVLYNWCAAVDTFYAAGSQPELANASGHSSTTWTVTMPDGPRRGICPAGWHVPSNGEWTTMASLAGVGQNSGTGVGKLTGGCDWFSNGSGSDSYPGNYSYTDRNATGFSALPAGQHNGPYSGGSYNCGYYANFWSSTPYGIRYAYQQKFGFINEYVCRDCYSTRLLGFSVRCLRDNTGVTLGEVTKTDSTLNSLSISAEYTATQDVTSATICAYTNEECTEPATPICATGSDVTIGESAITGTIEGLEHSTQYYVKVSVTTEGGTESKVGGPFGTKELTLTITSNPASATVKLCGDTLKVTYTATIANPDNYTYAWKVNGTDSASATGNTLMVNITTANSYKVTCVATNTADASVTAKDSVTTTVQTGAIPSMGICTDCDAGKAYIKSVSNVSSASWKQGGVVKYNYKSKGTYTIESGTYTVEVKSADGCAAIYENITIDKQYTHCTVNTIRGNEMGSGTQLDSVKDHENNWYEVVQIGTGANAQCWLKENMRAKTEPDGTPILQNPAQSNSSYTAKYAYYYDNNADNYAKYGCLYTWAAAMNGVENEGARGICPEGWHVPTDAEWTTLPTNAGVGHRSGTGVGKLTGGCDWYSSSTATYPNNYAYSERNSTGFSVLPAGYFNGSSVNFNGVSYYANFWSSTPGGSSNALCQEFNRTLEFVYPNGSALNNGLSVRCLRDNTGVTLGAVTKTDSTLNSLSISAEYTATQDVTSATICAYTNEECTEPATPICATGSDVTIGESAITGTIEGLEPSTQYYVKVSVTTEGGTESKVGGPFGTKALTLTLTSNPASATVKMCGQSSVTVTYTANLEGGTAETYSWSTSGGTPTSSTTNTYTVNYTTTGTYTVTCTAAGVSATKVVTITSGGTAATLGLCETCNEGTVTVKSGNCTSLTWVNNEDPTKTATTAGTANTVLSVSTNTPAGVYTVTGTKSDGCTVTRTAVLGEYVAHPCTVTNIRTNESGSGNLIYTVSDHQGNVYRVVQIGEGANAQCWLAENMRATTSPSTGSTILMTMVKSLSSKSASYYNGNVLYNWCAAVDTFNAKGGQPELANASGHSSSSWSVTLPTHRRGICPEGWHVPTKAEWETLTTSAGVGVGSGGTGAGKLAGGCDWIDCTSIAAFSSACGDYSYAERNSTGFSARPAGYYYYGNNRFTGASSYAHFWSSTPGVSSSYAFFFYLCHNSGYVTCGSDGRSYGCSVRCVRDN